MGTIMIAVMTGLTGLSLLVASVAVYIGLKAYIAIQAMKQSTHKIEYVGYGVNGVTKSDNLTDLDEYSKKVSEELNETFPFFNNEDTKKVRGL